ncbi:flagellin [Arcobacter ellisii]|uniref:FlaG family protein n=1 Tax=Arcobacter ellisii TaxID=913109 RepID=A0A347UAV8_9BACT|nr:flagellin [Arcobacter ellisii]AXX95986.1 FlaG family protein [Arcobacter ellisii]RXI29361.1 flagellin [Arcobacter ellisii]
MEIGRVAEIDNAKLNNSEKVKKVSEVNDKNKVIQDDEYKKSVGNQDSSEKNEVILDNIRFGYNKNSRDFFVKVTRGDAEYKYPTEDMMKVKAFILQELEQNSKE